MVPWVEVLAAKLDDLSSVPGTHVVEGENLPVQVVCCQVSTDAVVHLKKKKSRYNALNDITQSMGSSYPRHSDCCIRSPGTEVTDSYELPCGCRELNPGVL
ncbi:hypothetical protein H671_7g17502 [Cricetulus griseus]|nr:hypothetical protein H671_7g17502 [Cricetulus griseus]